MQKATSTEPSSEWDTILRSKEKWFRIDLKGIWAYRDLILLFVRRDFVASYKQTVLGPLWMLLQPLLTTLTFTIIFGQIAKIPTSGIPHILFYMSGLIPWTYFSDCLTKTSNTFLVNAPIFGKVYFPRMVSPLSVILSNLIKFGIQSLMLTLIYVIIIANGSDLRPDYHILFLPILIFLLAGLGFSVGIIISSMTIKYRDLSYLVSFGTQLLMYGSSVIFSIDIMGPTARRLIAVNPVIWVIESFRYALLGVGVWSWYGLAYSFCFMVIALLVALVMFQRVEKTFMDTV